MSDTSDLIKALQQQTEAINTFAVAVAQLSDAVVALIDNPEGDHENTEQQTYMDGTKV